MFLPVLCWMHPYKRPGCEKDVAAGTDPAHHRDFSQEQMRCSGRWTGTLLLLSFQAVAAMLAVAVACSEVAKEEDHEWRGAAPAPLVPAQPPRENCPVLSTLFLASAGALTNVWAWRQTHRESRTSPYTRVFPKMTTCTSASHNCHCSRCSGLN